MVGVGVGVWGLRGGRGCRGIRGGRLRLIGGIGGGRTWLWVGGVGEGVVLYTKYKISVGSCVIVGSCMSV